MEKPASSKNETYHYSGGLVERLLYGLVTLLFCTAPFLIPGIDMRQGVAVLFGATIILFFVLIAYTLFIQARTSRSRRR